MGHSVQRLFTNMEFQSLDSLLLICLSVCLSLPLSHRDNSQPLPVVLSSCVALKGFGLLVVSQGNVWRVNHSSVSLQLWFQFQYDNICGDMGVSWVRRRVTLTSYVSRSELEIKCVMKMWTRVCVQHIFPLLHTNYTAQVFTSLFYRSPTPTDLWHACVWRMRLVKQRLSDKIKSDSLCWSVCPRSSIQLGGWD